MVGSLIQVLFFGTFFKGQNQFGTSIYGATWVYGIGIHIKFEKPINWV
jgi:hypothetical protein